MVEHNSSEITLRDVWEQLNFFRQSLDTIKQNGVMIETKMDFVMTRVNENEMRLRTVEQLFAILNDVPERFDESLLEILTILGKRGWQLDGVDKYDNYVFSKEV